MIQNEYNEFSYLMVTAKGNLIVTFEKKYVGIVVGVKENGAFVVTFNPVIPRSREE